MLRKINHAGFALIQHFELLRPAACLDPVGIWDRIPYKSVTRAGVLAGGVGLPP
jgi:hypothetical protein